MSLTNVAMIGILLSFLFLLMGVLMEGRSDVETAWIKGKQPVKRGGKKRVARLMHPRRAA
jgi:hypothetical protein